MRELKFRAWDKQTLQMSPEFVLFGEFTLLGAVHDWQHDCGNQSNTSLEALNDLEVMQFTGLKDKNGVDIFEGDIVLIEGNKNTLVSWSNQYSSFVLKNDTWLFQHWFGEACEATDCEVVGNIYQHKHLLK